MLSLGCIWFIVILNSYSVKLTQKFMKFFGYGKLISLAIIITGGLVLNIMGTAYLLFFVFQKSFVYQCSNSIVVDLLHQKVCLYKGKAHPEGFMLKNAFKNGTEEENGVFHFPQISAIGLGLYQVICRNILYRIIFFLNITVCKSFQAPTRKICSYIAKELHILYGDIT